ncbi:hypothetical protein FACS1894110_20610 [Spirochaetia bacterium]|nr:hypothetical protein FACS1894110_20610 [Spirochaetia bacterium]
MQDIVLQQFYKLVQMLGSQFGESCQIILYNLEHKHKKLSGTVGALSGTLTSAAVGDPLPEFINHYIAQNGERDEFGFINKSYPGLVLRSSLLFIKEEKQKARACFCIHHNIVHIQMMISFLEEFTRSNKMEDEDETELAARRPPGGKMYSASDIKGFIDNIVSEFIVERLGQYSFAALEKNDKIALIAELDAKGLFLVKGVVNLLAKRMNISKFSIYNYLDEIRTAKATS